jgi:hypothetical protein
MRYPMLACAGLAVIGGIVSVNLWRELRTERQLSRELRAQLAEAFSRPPAPVPAMDGSGLDAPPAGAPSAALPNSKPSGNSQTTAAAPIAGVVSGFSPNSRDMMSDPEYRKARLAQMRMSLLQSYPGLAAELGLSRAEADELFDLLAENQLVMSSTPVQIGPDGQVDQNAMLAMAQSRQEMQRKQEETVAALLGTRYPQWQDYQQTRPARQQVMNIGRTLDAIGMPLSDAQRRPLVAAYVTEQKRQQQERMGLREGAARGPQDPAQMLEENFRRQSESNRRILDAAAGHLSAEQLDTLRASMEQQLTMNRASSRMMREQMDATGQGAAMPASAQFSIGTVF